MIILKLLEAVVVSVWVYLLICYINYGRIWRICVPFVHFCSIYLAIRFKKLILHFVNLLSKMGYYILIFLLILKCTIFYGPRCRFIKRVYVYIRIMAYNLKKTKIFLRICNSYKLIL